MNNKLEFNVVNANDENNTLTLNEATEVVGVYKVAEMPPHMQGYKDNNYYLIVSEPGHVSSTFVRQGKNESVLFGLTEDNRRAWEQAKYQRTNLSATVVLE